MIGFLEAFRISEHTELRKTAVAVLEFFRARAKELYVRNPSIGFSPGHCCPIHSVTDVQTTNVAGGVI